MSGYFFNFICCKILTMKRILFSALLLFCFVLSVCTCVNYQDKELAFKKLKYLESIMDVSPEIVLDSLAAIDPARLSAPNKSYYGLLETIAKDKSHAVFENDSTISTAVEWYSGGKDHYNYARALLYKGIVKYRIDVQDTLAYVSIKEAERVLGINGLENKLLQAMIYCYLGMINASKKNFKEAIEYYNLSASYYREMRSIDNYVIVMCDLAWAEMAIGRSDDAIKTIDIVASIDSLSPGVELYINNAYVGYYSNVENYRSALDYIKRRMSLGRDAGIVIDERGAAYSISRYYIKLNMLDSALVYCEILNNSLKDGERDVMEDTYYRHISSIYKLAKKEEKAFEFLAEAYYSLRKSTSERSAQRILELEKQYDLSEKDLQLEKEKNKVIIQQWIMLMFITIVTFMAAIIYMRIRLNKKEQLMAETKMRNKDLMNELLMISSRTLPNMLDEISTLSESLRSRSDRLSNEFKYALNGLKARYKDEIYTFVEKKLSAIDPPMIAREEFLQLNSTEKLVLFLLNQNYTTKEVAYILNTTESSVRSQKSRLKRYFIAKSRKNIQS